MTEQTASPRIAIIGGGPMGLEAALFGRRAGYELAVFERGSIAHNVRDWGHVRLFSPFGLNSSPWGRDALAGQGIAIPDDEALLTGRDYADRYLSPLAELPELTDCLHCNTTVLSVGRSQQLKTEHIGQSARSATKFRLLLETPGSQNVAEADVVLDCSGTYPHHNWLGTGGMPCPGEQDKLSQEHYKLPDVFCEDRTRFAGKTVLVVGSGYSAATTIVALAKLSESAPITRAIWLTRKPADVPLMPIPEDSLVERDRLTRQANELATSNPSPIDWRPGSEVESVEATHPGYRVVIHHSDGKTDALVVDEIVAQVGYRPDRTITEELQVHECYASHGPMKLAAALLQADGGGSADCLTQTGHGADSLKNPEPGFFILGSKSYGRGSRFLLKIGLEQIRDVFDLIASQHPITTTA